MAGIYSTVLPSEENIRFVMGEYPIAQIQLSGRKDARTVIDKIFRGENESSRLILSLKVGLETLVYSQILSMLTIDKNYAVSTLSAELAAVHYKIAKIVIAYPNLNSARFFLPYDDLRSLRYLFREIFGPRRYSLGIINRVLFTISLWALKVFRNPVFLYRNMLLLIEKT